MMKRPHVRMLELQVENWNLKWPIGTEVDFHPVIDNPVCRRRKTRSKADILSGHTAVIWLEGESGCVALEACVPVEQ
jgi:hypothetical protein